MAAQFFPVGDYYASYPGLHTGFLSLGEAGDSKDQLSGVRLPPALHWDPGPEDWSPALPPVCGPAATTITTTTTTTSTITS